MKKFVKFFVFSAILACGSMLSTGCGTPFPLGCVYTKVVVPVTVGSGEVKCNRIGEAKCSCIMGLFAGGDASINEAVKNGQITKVSWVNQRIENICGIYGTYTTVVYGFGETADVNLSPDAREKVKEIHAAKVKEAKELEAQAQAAKAKVDGN